MALTAWLSPQPVLLLGRRPGRHVSGHRRQRRHLHVLRPRERQPDRARLPGDRRRECAAPTSFHDHTRASLRAMPLARVRRSPKASTAPPSQTWLRTVAACCHEVFRVSNARAARAWQPLSRPSPRMPLRVTIAQPPFQTRRCPPRPTPRQRRYRAQSSSLRVRAAGGRRWLLSRHSP